MMPTSSVGLAFLSDQINHLDQILSIYQYNVSTGRKPDMEVENGKLLAIGHSLFPSYTLVSSLPCGSKSPPGSACRGNRRFQPRPAYGAIVENLKERDKVPERSSPDKVTEESEM